MIAREWSFEGDSLQLPFEVRNVPCLLEGRVVDGLDEPVGALDDGALSCGVIVVHRQKGLTVGGQAQPRIVSDSGGHVGHTLEVETTVVSLCALSHQ